MKRNGKVVERETFGAATSSWAPCPHALLLALFLLTVAACRPTEPLPPADAGPVSVQSNLSTNAIRVGDIVELDLVIQHPADGTLRLPELAREPEIVVRAHQASRQPAPGGRAVTRAQYRLTSFRVGAHALLTNAIEFLYADERVLEIPPPFLNLTVQTSLPDPQTALRDIKEPATWPAAWPRKALLLLAVILIIATLAGLIGWLVWRAAARPAAPAAPPAPPHERALRALRALREQGWIEAGRVEPFYVELSAIVRRYLEDRFQLRAPERTTEEFIREAISSRRLSPEHQQLTAAFLEQADLVKFARHRPQAPDMEAAWQAAERLVLETQPVAEVAA
jgi:hypothetical protein